MTKRQDQISVPVVPFPVCTECHQVCRTIAEDENSDGICLGCRDEMATDDAIRRLTIGW